VECIKKIGSKWVKEIRGLNDKLVMNDRLFTQDFGKPMHPNAPSLFFGRFCKRKGLTYRKGHSLRHLNVSIQIFAGVERR
jgi:integrase